MNKKDEALKKCLRVLNPIANEKVYEAQWIDSAIHACYEALEEKEEPINDVSLREYYTSYTLKNKLSIEFDKFKSLVRLIESHHGIDDDNEAQDALENIEQEIIARACRNGVCED